MRYHLFTGQGYYPQSGLGDYEDSFDTLSEAVDAGRVKCGDTKPDDYVGYWYSDDWYSVIQEQEGRLVEVASGWKGRL